MNICLIEMDSNAVNITDGQLLLSLLDNYIIELKI